MGSFLVRKAAYDEEDRIQAEEAAARRREEAVRALSSHPPRALCPHPPRALSSHASSLTRVGELAPAKSTNARARARANTLEHGYCPDSAASTVNFPRRLIHTVYPHRPIPHSAIRTIPFTLSHIPTLHTV